jgi:hypothetical protein
MTLASQKVEGYANEGVVDGGWGDDWQQQRTQNNSEPYHRYEHETSNDRNTWNSPQDGSSKNQNSISWMIGMNKTKRPSLHNQAKAATHGLARIMRRMMALIVTTVIAPATRGATRMGPLVGHIGMAASADVGVGVFVRAIYTLRVVIGQKMWLSLFRIPKCGSKRVCFFVSCQRLLCSGGMFLWSNFI